MTIEELYQTYLDECLTVRNGCRPRPVRDFSRFRESDSYPFFERLLQMKERSHDMLNERLLMRALAHHYRGFFPPRAMTSQAGMALYREFIAEFGRLKEPADIYARLLEDCRFVARFCLDNSLPDGLMEYVHHGEALIPSLVKHAYAGFTSPFFLAAIDTFPVIFRSYPEDARELLRDFDYRLNRIKVAQIPKCKVVADNLDRFISMAMRKMADQSSLNTGDKPAAGKD